MCGSCNGDSNGHAANDNGTNGTNGNGNNNEEFVPIKPAYQPPPVHKSSPYAPVGDFLSNVSRFKIIGTSFQPPWPRSLPYILARTHILYSFRTSSQALSLSGRLVRVDRLRFRGTICRLRLVGARSELNSAHQFRIFGPYKTVANKSAQKAHFAKANSSPMLTSTLRPRSRLLEHSMISALIVHFCPATRR